MPLLTDDELTAYPEPTAAEVVPNHVARYADMMSLAQKHPVKVIGNDAMLRDRPGFEVSFVTRGAETTDFHSHDRASVLMPMRGYWRLTWGDQGGAGGSTVLNPGDTCLVPAGLPHGFEPSMSGEASLFHVLGTDDPAGLTGRLL